MCVVGFQAASLEGLEPESFIKETLNPNSLTRNKRFLNLAELLFGRRNNGYNIYSSGMQTFFVYIFFNVFYFLFSGSSYVPNSGNHGFIPQEHGITHNHGFHPQEHGITHNHGFHPQEHGIHK